MAGAGYKLFATGDVLTAAQVNTYLMQQTVMVFASSAARTSALSGVLAEGMVSYLQDTNTLEVYDGSAWIGATGDITALTAGTGISITNPTGPVPTVAIDTAVTADLTTGQTLTNKTLTSPVLTTPSISNINAKGDILVGTADNTLGVITAGSDGQELRADSTAATGLSWANNFSAGKNKIINGDMRVSQRGTTFSNPANFAFSLDRYAIYYDGTGATRTISQQTFTPGTAPVAGYEDANFFRYAQTVAGSGNTVNLIYQRIEDVRTLAGTSAVLSFWAKADSARTVTTTARQYFGSGGSGDVNTGFTGSASVTTSWQRFTFTISMPSISGKTIGTSSALEIQLALPSGTTPTIDIWGLQLEQGSTATAFQTATGTIGGELALCQRYYEKSYEQGVAPATSTYNGMNVMQLTSSGTGNLRFSAYFKVEKRVYPTIRLYDNAGAIDKVDYNFTAGKTGTAVSFPKFADVYSDGTTSKSSMGYHFTADAEL